MNDMNEQQDLRWKNLLALSAPACAGELAPPYGMVTSTLARLRAETRQTELAERIGLRAFFASLAVLACTIALTLEVSSRQSSDLEPGLKNIVQVENVQLS
jgi:hypothetical protein